MTPETDQSGKAREESRRRKSGFNLAIAVLCALVLWCHYEHRRAAAQRHAFDAARLRLVQMTADAERILALNTAPQCAADRQRPNDELLDSIRGALEGGGIGAEHWLANDPSPPVRIPQTAYKELATRLSLERVTLQHLVAALDRLVEQDPTLTITRLRLSAPPEADGNEWNAEVVVSYLMYSPTESAPSQSGAPNASASNITGVRS